VEGEYNIQIAFDDRAPVIETLETLKTQVATTVQAFEPEF